MCRQCGLVNWQSYTESSVQHVDWNVTFTKTRPDTVLRILYTSSIGAQTYSGWNCFMLSVLINGSQCANPAPIRGGVTMFVTVETYVTNIFPAAVSGVCYITTAGPLQISTAKTNSCTNSYGQYDGFYHLFQKNDTLTATMFVEEYLPCN